MTNFKDPKCECQFLQIVIKKMDNKSSTSSRSPGDVEGEPVPKKTRLVHKTIIYDESVANQWLDEPPLEVWDHHIIPLLSLRDLALSRTVCTNFNYIYYGMIYHSVYVNFYIMQLFQ